MRRFLILAIAITLMVTLTLNKNTNPTAEVPMSTNRDYFERQLSTLFDGQLIPDVIVAYAEEKNAYNSDLYAVAKLKPGAAEGITTTPISDWMMTRFDDAVTTFPSLSLGAMRPNSLAATSNSTGAEVTLFVLDGGTAVLIWQDR